ncbi:MAG: hypothetical protein AB1428_09090 [Bacteroidota bacterium]
MSTPRDGIQRRDFLGTLLASTTIGLAGLSAPINLAGAQEKPAAMSGSSDFETWLGKIKGKHRQVFDSPDPHGGLPLAWARVFLMTNKMVGVPDDDVSAVIVLRHDSIPLAMEDKLWKKYNFGKMFGAKDMMTNAILKRNVFWKPKEGSLPVPGMGVDELLNSGVLIGACDMALTVYSKMTAEKMKLNPDEVKKEWVAGVFPGIQLVPSGVLAINRAQEHGCTYCYAG